jgi:hypothetical protein
MKTLRSITQDIDPAPESEEPGLPMPQTLPFPANGVTAETPHPGGSTRNGDAHIGATEDQISDRHAPAGQAYRDEPRQG